MKVHTTLKLALLAGALTSGMALSAASPVRPSTIAPGELCYRCNRLVSDRWVAGQTVGENNLSHKFRTVRCMLTYLRGTPDPYKEVFVADDQTGTFINVEDAVYVPVAIDAFTGEKDYGMGDVDYIAFKSEKAARQFAAERGVTTMNWPAVQYYAARLPVTVEIEAHH